MEPRERKPLADRWLDAALKRYGQAEPLPGMERRVLANLRAEKPSIAEHWNWWPMLGTLAVLVVGTSTFLIRGRGVAPGPVERHAVLSASPKEATVFPPLVAGSAVSLSAPSVRSTRTAGHRTRPAIAISEDAPWLEQFPSPRPLSEQEKLLMIYVRQSPREAMLMARAETELRKRELVEGVDDLDSVGMQGP
jgi:hypothetical protein